MRVAKKDLPTSADGVTTDQHVQLELHCLEVPEDRLARNTSLVVFDCIRICRNEHPRDTFDFIV